MLPRGQHVQSQARPSRGARLIPGKNGLSGTPVLIGAPPSDAAGVDGTVYIDTNTSTIYQKSNGSYGNGFPLIAPP